MNIDDLMRDADYMLGDEAQPYRINESGAMLLQHIRKVGEAKAALAKASAGCSLLDVLRQFPLLACASIVIKAEAQIDDQGVWFTSAYLDVEDPVLEQAAASQGEGMDPPDKAEEALAEEMKEYLQNGAIDLYRELGGDLYELHSIVIRLDRQLLSELPADASRSGARFVNALEQRGCIELK